LALGPRPAKIGLGWPAKIKVGTRNFRNRSQLEAFKANLSALALAEREGAHERNLVGGGAGA